MCVAHSLHRRFCGVALVAAVLSAGSAAGQHNLSEQGYEKVKSLKEAVGVVKAQLTADGKPEYAALVTEDRMQGAIRTAVKGYDAILARNPNRPGLAKDRWEKELKPAYLAIAEKGDWPANCAFGGFYRLTDELGVAYDGLGLRLYLGTQAEPRRRFALPVVDMYFGKFETPRR
jgi:hypothetical protein